MVGLVCMRLHSPDVQNAFKQQWQPWYHTRPNYPCSAENQGKHVWATGRRPHICGHTTGARSCAKHGELRLHYTTGRVRGGCLRFTQKFGVPGQLSIRIQSWCGGCPFRLEPFIFRPFIAYRGIPVPPFPNSTSRRSSWEEVRKSHNRGLSYLPECICCMILMILRVVCFIHTTFNSLGDHVTGENQCTLRSKWNFSKYLHRIIQTISKKYFTPFKLTIIFSSSHASKIDWCLSPKILPDI